MNLTPLNRNLVLNRNLHRLGQRIKIMIKNKIKTESALATRPPSPVTL